MKEHKSILIVEDDEDLSSSLSRSFVRRGYDVKVAKSTKEAVESLSKFHPCYAVVDLKMVGESGLECIKKLHEFDSSMKIVMLTGYASITTTIEAIKLGACYYLAKPANADDIIAAFMGKKAGEKDAVLSKKTSIKNVEWEHIHEVLLESDFNVSKAARILGMHRRTLARKLEKRRVKE